MNVTTLNVEQVTDSSVEGVQASFAPSTVISRKNKDVGVSSFLDKESDSIENGLMFPPARDNKVLSKHTHALRQ